MADYFIDVKTEKYLGHEVFVEKLLTEWCHDSHPSLRPEYFDLGEPVRRSFIANGVDSAVQTWISNGMGLMLKRRSKPKFISEVDWFDRQKGLDPRLFPWGCSVSLHSSAGDDRALELLMFLTRHLEPAFGFVANDRDHRTKHFITFEDQIGTTEMYMGMDILEGEEKLPGVYWATYFGPWAVEKIGEERFAQLKAQSVETVNSGYLVLAYNSCSKAGTPNAHDAEEQIKMQLGKNHFFDKSKVNIQELKADQEEVEIIEKKILELTNKKNAKKKGAKTRA